MMKSPTSLIRFRNAVGVMLAMSAIFAVVISAVTITQDRALAQDPANPTVTLTVDNETVAEGSAVTFTVTLSAAVAAGADNVVIPITVTDGTAMKGTDFTLPDDGTPPVETTSVTFTAGGSTTDTYVVTTIDTPDPDDSTSADFDEPQESFTVSLGMLPSGYDAGATDSFTININDGDNTAATGDVTINFQDEDGNLVTFDADSDTATPEIPVTTATTGDDAYTPKSGDTLVANTDAILDADNVVGTNDPATEHDDDDVSLTFTYQWIRTNDGSTADDDDDVVIEGATSSTYLLTDDDVGDTFNVQVWSSDQYGNGNANANADCLDAAEPDCDTSTAPIDENSNGQTLARPTTVTAAVAYNQAKPFIIVGSLEPSGDDDRIEPGVVLTRDYSGFNIDSAFILLDDEGMQVMVDRAGDGTADETVATSQITLTWYRGDDPILCDVDDDGTLDEVDANGDPGTDGVDDEECGSLATATTVTTYMLTNEDVTEEITLRATYITQAEIAEDLTADPPVMGVAEQMATIISEPLDRVYSPNKATGEPQISGTAQVGSTLMASLGNVADADADADGNTDLQEITYTWYYGDDDDNSASLGSGTTYTLKAGDAGKTIKVEVSFIDALDDPDSRESAATSPITGSPGEISRIEPVIRGVTLSAGDTVILSVDIYGLQDVKDNTLSGTFDWGSASDETGREIEYIAPSSPGTYTITASLNDAYCSPEDEEMRADACSATFEVRVRRPSVAQPPEEAPVNPPGDIPGILADSDGNQYEVFTPVDGGTFSGEGYSLNVPSGAVPNGEFIGIRMSDDGAASNAGMTHQRYTLGGNMYGVHAVDSSGDSISSYALDDPATVCLPLPDALRQNISDLAVVAINGDGSLTILSAQVRIGDAGTMVCGGLSNLPASVAVGSAGAPAAIPTPTPEPTPVAPDTGGTAPASSTMVLWALLLGIATLALGSVLVIGRRREGVRK